LEEHSFEELSSILDLSTRWGFASIRELAIRCLDPPTPLERLILGQKYGIDQWIPSALQELCERPQPLTPDEARLMDFEDVVLVGSVREKVRKQTLIVNSKRIEDCIEALRRGEPWERPSDVPPPVSSTPVLRPPVPPPSVFPTAFPTTINSAFAGFR
jgi:hypothetical protein